MCKFKKMSANGRFFIKRNKTGGYGISLTLFDFGGNPKSIEDAEELLQGFLLELHQGSCRLDNARLVVDKYHAVDRADFVSLSFEIGQEQNAMPQSDVADLGSGLRAE